MDHVDHRVLHDDLGRPPARYAHVKDEPADPRRADFPAPAPVATDPVGYTLMVAGRRTGKTSFLRLLLDTSALAHSVSRDQLLHLARFVHASPATTARISTVSVDIDLALAEADEPQPLALTLVDTPSLDFADDAACQRTIADILRHVDSRFAESVEDDHLALRGDHHVHLCIYFLDPESIVPPPAPSPPFQPASREHANGLSPHADPYMLEPPVSAQPALCQPVLPQADIAAIRRLSARVNVLPVVACADTLTNERLNAVKMAIRRDLAEAGIGFGIFDLDTMPQYHACNTHGDPTASKHSPDTTGGQNGYTNGATSSRLGAAPVPPSPPRLPFALISPDIYSHSDGVVRPAPSCHDLVHQYSPSNHAHQKNRQLSKIVLGKFIRNYRWGHLDVLDVKHSDFLFLRGAVFHHMQTLRKYTREYLLDKYKLDMQLQAPHLQSLPRVVQTSASAPRPALTHSSRPILAIDTAPQSSSRRSSVSAPRALPAPNSQLGSGHLSAQDASAIDSSPKTTSSSRSQRQRSKKITVACNFCRSRKLKCDGGRPACGQCFKRSNPCDYMAGHKRRGANGRQRKTAESESDDDDDEQHSPSAGGSHPSQSPEFSRPPSRPGASAHRLAEAQTLPPLSSAIERQEDPPASAVLAPMHGHSHSAPHAYLDARTDLPPIATLNVPAAAHDDAHLVASFKSEAGGRRRAASTASMKSRTSNHGSKIVACNICRARKTRCDGTHPTCGTCSRRNLPCSYVTDGVPSRSRKNPGTSTAPTSARSSPTGHLQHASGVAPGPSNGYVRTITVAENGVDLSAQPNKKMRMSDGGVPVIAVIRAP